MSEPMRIGDILGQITKLATRDQIRQVLSGAGWSDPGARMFIPDRGETSPVEQYFNAVVSRPLAHDPQRYAEFVAFSRDRCRAFLFQHGPSDWAPGWTLDKVMDKLNDIAVLRSIQERITARTEQLRLFPDRVSTHS